MKYLIVNADDFGASQGINRGIIDAHEQGILTSTSLLVTAPWSKQAASLGRNAPELSVGLHVDLGNLRSLRPTESRRDLRDDLRAQFIRFGELMGEQPTHIDSHHNVHRDPQLLPLFMELARDYALPLREHSSVRYYAKFYGQWGGESHPEQISPENLERILEAEVSSGVTELSCHPGYLDPDFLSGYSAEREAELIALCHPRIRQVLQEQSIELMSYHELTKTRVRVYA
jgi:chitin disaccharide deacetylase